MDKAAHKSYFLLFIGYISSSVLTYSARQLGNYYFSKWNSYLFLDAVRTVAISEKYEGSLVSWLAITYYRSAYWRNSIEWI